MERIIIKSFKNLKEIKNRDEYIKLCEINYANTFLEVIGRSERIVRILPTEIINPNLENKFTDIRGLTEDGEVMIIEGHAGQLKRHHLERYYGYFKDTYCDFSKMVKLIIGCLSAEKNLKKTMVEENVCFKPIIVELKKIDGNKYLNRLGKKFNDNIELDHKDCALLVHLLLFKLNVSEEDYIREICGYIKDYDCIPEGEKNVIVPAMYLNIAQHIGEEYEQEKLLGVVNILKYCENELDKKIRIAKEEEAKNITEHFACKLLRDNHDEEYVHKMTDLHISRINELKANL